MTDDPIETIELPEDTADLQRLYAEPDGEEPQFHPVLEVWREVLSPAREELSARITPQWATRIVGSYSQMTYADMAEYRDLYYNMILDLLDILNLEITSDRDCLTYRDPQEDAVENSHHYLNLLLNWQMYILAREMEWDCQTPDAASRLAAISEVHKMFFGAQGVTAFLENIGFEFTDDDSLELMAALEEFKTQ